MNCKNCGIELKGKALCFTCLVKERSTFKDYTEDKASSFEEMWDQIKTDVINVLREKFLNWVNSLLGPPKRGDKFEIDSFKIEIK